ncbi:MAG: arginine--tRNA ligase [Planctomycetes bacterium]|nr:arginine--tRNA ligase [Planctomycetota bacterium]
MKDLLRKAASRLTEPIPEFNIIYNTDLKFADVSTDIGFKLASLLKDNPNNIAQQVAQELKQMNHQAVGRVEVLKGYINIFYSQNYLEDIYSKIIKEDSIYGSHPKKKFRINMEFISANPTGPLHIAHGRQAIIGDVVSNVLTKAGYDVQREYYINDSGNQIEMLGKSLYVRYQQICGVNAELGENSYKGEYLIDLAKEFKEQYGDKYLKEPDLKLFKEFAAAKLLEQIKQTASKAGIKMDYYASQKQLENESKDKEIIGFLSSKGMAFEKDGALWAKSTSYGDDQDRVIRKSDGLFPYRVSDYAYHLDKFKRDFDLLIDIWGPDHHSHIKDVSSFLQFAGYDKDRFKVLIIQHCRVISGGKEVKMSKRNATFITLDELLDDIPRDVVRYFFSMRKPETHLDFDLDLAIKKSMENPVYYVQYAYARINSIFKKAKELDIKHSGEDLDFARLNQDERDLLRLLVRFPNFVEISAKELDPTPIVSYTMDVARSFQSYYQKADKDRSLAVLCDDVNAREARLKLLKAVQIVLKNCFDILGISAPDKM